MSTLFDDRAVRYMTDLIRDFDLEDFQAAGVCGSGGEESGGFTKTQEIAPASGRGGLGDFQWTGPRRVAFETWLTRNSEKGWTAATYEANYSMLFRELVGPERRALDALKATHSLEEATEVFMDKFERPGVPALDVRISYARQALAAFKAAGVDVAKLRTPQDQMPPAHQLPPLTEIITTVKPALDQILPVVLPMLINLMQQKSGGVASGQSKGGDLLTMLLPVLQQILTPQQQPPVIIQTPPAPPAPAPAPAPKSAVEKPSVGLGLLGLFTSAIGMATGAVGTPFGMGSDPTTAGTLSVLIPAAISAVGATGIFGPVGSVIARMAGAAFATAQKK